MGSYSDCDSDGFDWSLTPNIRANLHRRQRVPEEALDEMEEIAFGPSQMELQDLSRRGIVPEFRALNGDVRVVGVRAPLSVDLTAAGAADGPAAGPVDPSNPRRSLTEDPFYIGGFYGGNGLSAAARSRVPRTVATSADEQSMERDCTVCREPCKAGQEISRLPCNNMHVFHTKCILKWLEDSTMCPECRKKVTC